MVVTAVVASGQAFEVVAKEEVGGEFEPAGPSAARRHGLASLHCS